MTKPGGTVLLDDVIDRHSILVVERGRQPSLSQGTRGVLGRFPGQRTDLLDGYLAVQSLIYAQPHRAHSPTTDGILDSVPSGNGLGLHQEGVPPIGHPQPEPGSSAAVQPANVQPFQGSPRLQGRRVPHQEASDTLWGVPQ